MRLHRVPVMMPIAIEDLTGLTIVVRRHRCLGCGGRRRHGCVDAQRADGDNSRGHVGRAPQETATTDRATWNGVLDVVRAHAHLLQYSVADGLRITISPPFIV